MSVSLLKIIDEYFGRVIVFFISIFKNKKRSSKDEPVRNILFIKFWGIGSIILTTPALNKVKAVYPDSTIYFLTLKNNQEICDEIKIIDEIITIDISNPGRFFFDIIRKIKILREINFDVVFDFEFYTYFSAVIVSFLKTKRSFGFDNLKNKRKIIFTETILFKNKEHTKNNFLNLVDADENVSSAANSSAGFINFVNHSNNKNGELKIIVNPNASKLAYERRLPKGNYVEIIDHITNEFKCNVSLIGSEDEVEYVDDIYSRLNNKIMIKNLCGKTSVRELITLINSSAIVITNDSGPLHIASALNVPVIAFFGPESPERYGPLSEKKLIFYKELKCSPCMSISNSKTVNCIYDSPKCMEQFAMEAVIRKIDVFINDIIAKQELRSSLSSRA